MTPRFKIKYGENVGVELFFKAPEIQDNEKTFLSADEASGQTTLSVISGRNFSNNDYVVIGNIGQEDCEIRLISSQTDSTIVTDATLFTHQRGTKVQFIPYNQIIPERSTNSGSSYSALSAINIRPDATETYLQRVTDSSTDYYRFRFYNSTSTNYSQYGDGVIATGYVDNSVYSIKQRALRQMGEKVGDSLTDEFLNEALWEGRRELDKDPRVLRWSFRVKYDQDIGSAIPGTYTLALPTDLRDKKTNKNILSLRFGEDNYPLEYQDKNTFNQNYRGISHTTLNGALFTSDTSITLTSSGDIAESGSIDIGASAVTGVIDNVAYTANNESTNVISGVTAIQSAGHTTLRDVWQGATFSMPTAYTIDGNNSQILFNVPISNDYAGENIWADYYTDLTAYDSDGDSLDEPDYDCFVSWLKYKIKYLKANGKINPKEDGDFLDWERRKEAMVAKEMTGQFVYLTPDI